MVKNMGIIQEISNGRFEVDKIYEDQIFKNVEFDYFSIYVIDSKIVKFKNCHFKKCKILDGSFDIGANVVFENVVFENFITNGDMVIDPSAIFINSTFISKNKRKLEIIDYDYPAKDCSLNKIKLDVSAFNGRLRIIGPDVSNVIINPNIHIFVSHRLIEQNEFKLNKANFFMNSSGSVKNVFANAGVFTIPDTKHRDSYFEDQLKAFKNLNLVATDFSNLEI